MDDRIKELSDIAYKNHLVRNPNSSFGRRSDYDREFAELIIRECIGQFIQHGVVSADGTIVKDIQKHFGV
jgi:hypothetical protein